MDFSNPADEIAPAAHRCWCKRMLAEGWRPGQRLDPKARTHDTLRPYRDLLPEDRERMRQRVTWDELEGALAQAVRGVLEKITVEWPDGAVAEHRPAEHDIEPADEERRRASRFTSRNASIDDWRSRCAAPRRTEAAEPWRGRPRRAVGAGGFLDGPIGARLSVQYRRMSTGAKQHWERVYTEKSPAQVSWYQQVPTLSLALIDAALAGIAPGGRGSERGFRIIDVGGGASTLVDHLIDRPGAEVCVVDIAGRALDAARERLGGRARLVRWVEADATGTLAEIDDGWADLWHDRAVFHFLTDPEVRQRYVAAAARVVAPGGQAIVATFALTGPEQCSGLPICRYDPARLAAEFGGAFRMTGSATETHTTPWGKPQDFTYVILSRV
jgi:SAM-dependent methyltransferase